MCRSSQPLTGIGGKREASDEKLINLYRTCGVLESASDSNDSERERFYILDARSWVAATLLIVGRILVAIMKPKVGAWTEELHQIGYLGGLGSQT